MPVVPPIDARSASAVGTSFLPPGPSLSAREVEALVAGLRAAALASERHVAEVTRLDAVADGGPMRVVDRPTWLRANVDMALTMLAEASGQPATPPAGLLDRVSARANGAQLGGVLAVLGTRILGQWLPFAAVPQLVLVAPNVAKIEAELGVVPADFRLWVCLHEQTHRLQFARAPWLRTHLIGELGRLLADPGEGTGDEAPPTQGEERAGRRKDAGEGEPGSRGRRPLTLLERFLTPEQQGVFERLTAVMSLLEGYADDMMDRVGPDVVPTVAVIRSSFEARRHRGGWTRVLNQALGLDLKLAQYRDGAAFCRAVIDRVGVDGLNAVYETPAHLPTAEEIRHPARWVHRVHD